MVTVSNDNIAQKCDFMVRVGELACPSCGGALKYYDKISRIQRTKAGVTNWVQMNRIRCTGCGMVHREISEDISPYKHYEVEVILGVIEGLISFETLGYEDYPCEMTMKRWIIENQRLCFN
ncbi:MAG: DUF6431 domain-containing protein, partial [Oscillospiraceae bacterium]|nr:DUF6431 domain-containing protein [Oscillospiraceae bacterium]